MRAASATRRAVTDQVSNMPPFYPAGGPRGRGPDPVPVLLDFPGRPGYRLLSVQYTLSRRTHGAHGGGDPGDRGGHPPPEEGAEGGHPRPQLPAGRAPGHRRFHGGLARPDAAGGEDRREGH